MTPDVGGSNPSTAAKLKELFIMKYFITSDVHSYYTELMTALNKEGFDINNKDHILCICGDLFDRGSEPIKLFEFVKNLNEQNRLIYIRGNHEDLLEQCVNEIRTSKHVGLCHFYNGTVETICRFCRENEWIVHDPSKKDFIYNTMKPILDFINKTSINYKEIGDYILVHGWVPLDTNAENFRNASEDHWKSARWTNGMAAWRTPEYRVKNKTVICGHYHCSWGWSFIRQERQEYPQKNRKDWLKSFEPFIDDGIMAIDACCHYSGKLNVIKLGDKNDYN